MHNPKISWEERSEKEGYDPYQQYVDAYVMWSHSVKEHGDKIYDKKFQVVAT